MKINQSKLIEIDNTFAASPVGILYLRERGLPCLFLRGEIDFGVDVLTSRGASIRGDLGNFGLAKSSEYSCW